MVEKIEWNQKAIEALEEILSYLEENNSADSAIKFLTKIDILIEKLKKYPEIGRRTKSHKTVRQYKIDKYKKLYYRKYGTKLIIVFIYDDRQNLKSNLYH